MKEEKRKAVWLSTSDNPFNPFRDLIQWFKYDNAKGYNCCQYVDKIALTSGIVSDEVNADAIEKAIDEIVEMDLIGIETDFKVNYIKVVEE